MSELEHKYIQANGIRYHYVTAGKGPPVVLLHGFPQFWYAWRHQISALAEHFTVIVPDLRGYGETERPKEISDYKLSHVSDDITALIHELGYEKAHIVGHDWGGAVAWQTAFEHPEVIDRLVILNSPHPVIFKRALRSNFRQMRKSWYVFFFQLPYLPEWLIKMQDKKLLKGLFRGIRKDTFSKEDLEQYLQALRKPGAITAALNYFRAALRNKDKPMGTKITAPTLLIWGENDIALGKELTQGMEPFFSAPFKIHYIANCSHWVNEEQPDLVNKLIIEHLQ